MTAAEAERLAEPTPIDGMDSALAPRDAAHCAGTPAMERLLQDLGQRLQASAGTILQLKELSEREVLACGDVLSEILQQVQALIAATSETLERSAAQSERANSGFIQDVRLSLESQKATADQVSALFVRRQSGEPKTEAQGPK